MPEETDAPTPNTSEESGANKRADVAPSKEADDALEQLEGRLKEARKKVSSDDEASDEEFNPLGKAYQMGMELVGGVVVGLVSGLFLDDLFDTKPIMLIIMLLLGFAASIRLMMKDFF